MQPQDTHEREHFLFIGSCFCSTLPPDPPRGRSPCASLPFTSIDEWDQELERRGRRSVRYMDDSNVYPRSERAGQRLMASLTAFITHRLKLKVNHTKSIVARPWQRKFLGFSFTSETQPRRRIKWQAVGRFKARVRELTGRAQGVSEQAWWRISRRTCEAGKDTSAFAKPPPCCAI